MAKLGSSNGGMASGSALNHFGNRNSQQAATVSPFGGGMANPAYTVHATMQNGDIASNNFNGKVHVELQQNAVPPSAQSEILAALTTKTPNASPQMSMAVLTLIVVASLCLVVGAIYLLIYFKSIKPMSARSRSYADPGGGKGDDDGGARKSAGHPFFRRK